MMTPVSDARGPVVVQAGLAAVSDSQGEDAQPLRASAMAGQATYGLWISG
jgi:hypothetical protein